MREAEQDGRYAKRGAAANAAFEQILHPGAKVEFLWNSDEDEDINPFVNHRELECAAMGMEKAGRPSQTEDQRGEENQFAEAGFPIAPAKVKIKTGPSEPADGHESIQRRIDAETFARPGGPARPACSA